MAAVDTLLEPPFRLPAGVSDVIVATRMAGGSKVIGSGTISSQDFVSGVSGWIIYGSGSVEFNSGTFRGTLEASSINIPDATTANSMHVDSNGNTWWGATTLGGATASVLSTGVATFTNVTITGGSVAGSTVGSGISGTNITTGTIDASVVGVANINASNITTGTISASRIGTGTITSTHIQNATITGTDIAALTITAANIAALTITADEIANLTITADEIANLTITGGKIGGNQIDGGHLQALSLTLGRYIRSNTYVSGTSGWAIDADGSAEFNNATIRGDLVAGTIDIGTNAFQVDNTGRMWLGAASFAAATFSVDTSGNVIMDGNVTIGGTVQHDTAGYSIRLANQGAGTPLEGGEIRFDAPNSGGSRVHLDIYRVSQYGVTTTNWFRFVNATSATQMFAVDEGGNAIILGSTGGYAMIQLGQSATAANNAWLRSGTSGDFQVYYSESAQTASNEGFKIGSGGQIYFPNIATTTDSALNTVRHMSTTTTPNYEVRAFTSSGRFKQNVLPLNAVLAAEGTRSRLYHPRLEPVLYKGVNAEGSDHWNASLITEDVAAVFPEWVTLGEDGLPFVYGETALLTHVLAELRNLRAEMDQIIGWIFPGYTPPEISPVPAEEVRRLERWGELLQGLPKIPEVELPEEHDKNVRRRVEAEAQIPEILRLEFPTAA